MNVAKRYELKILRLAEKRNNAGVSVIPHETTPGVLTPEHHGTMDGRVKLMRTFRIVSHGDTPPQEGTYLNTVSLIPVSTRAGYSQPSYPMARGDKAREEH